jgi:hypothetical protein
MEVIKNKSFCVWKENEDGAWATNCGQLFEVSNGTPEENGMLFCHFCGRKIHENKYFSGERSVIVKTDDAIKALEALILALKSGSLGVLTYEISSPVIQKDDEPFQDYKKFEYGSDIYLKLHLTRKDES